MKVIGNTFAQEIAAAGLAGLPFSWGDDGKISCAAEMTSAQREAVAKALEAHDPAVAVRTGVWDRIKFERDRRTGTGGYKVGNNWFHSDQKSRTQQLGLVALGDRLPDGVQWKTMSGSMVAMTPSLAQEILQAAAASDIATFRAAEAHRKAMEASPDPTVYDWRTDWPPVFWD